MCFIILVIVFFILIGSSLCFLFVEVLSEFLFSAVKFIEHLYEHFVEFFIE